MFKKAKHKGNKAIGFSLLIMLFYLFFSDRAYAQSIDEIIEEMTHSFAKLDNYQCILHKRELIKGEIREQRNIIYKFKKPLNVHMEWTEEPDRGTEVIHQKGKNDDKLQVRKGGIWRLLDINIDPSGSLAMRNNRHTILESHLGYVISLVRSNYERAIKNNELNASFEGYEILEAKETLLLKAVFPKAKGYYGHIIYLNVDRNLYLPVQIRVYGWEGELLERYHYSGLEVDVTSSHIGFAE